MPIDPLLRIRAVAEQHIKQTSARVKRADNRSVADMSKFGGRSKIRSTSGRSYTWMERLAVPRVRKGERGGGARSKMLLRIHFSDTYIDRWAPPSFFPSTLIDLWYHIREHGTLPDDWAEAQDLKRPYTADGFQGARDAEIIPIERAAKQNEEAVLETWRIEKRRLDASIDELEGLTRVDPEARAMLRRMQRDLDNLDMETRTEIARIRRTVAAERAAINTRLQTEQQKRTDEWKARFTLEEAKIDDDMREKVTEWMGDSKAGAHIQPSKIEVLRWG